MIGSVMRKIFGSANERYVKGLRKTVAKINALEAEIAPLTDEELKARTPMLKKRLADGETLDDILPIISIPLYNKVKNILLNPIERGLSILLFYCFTKKPKTVMISEIFLLERLNL